jgi:hypothetical protein
MLRVGWFALALLVATSARGAPLEPHEVPEDVYRDRTGLPELVVHNTLMGPIIGYNLTLAIFGSEQPTRAVSGLPLGFAAGLLLPNMLLRGKRITAAEASYYNFGERWGLINGILVPLLWNNDNGRTSAASAAAGGSIGLAATLLTQDELELTPGQASALGTAHIFGIFGAALLAWTFDVVPDSGASFAGPILLFSNASVAGVLLTRDVFDIDRRRVILIDLGGLVGLFAGVGAGFAIAGGEDWRGKGSIFGGSMLTGMVGGMALTYALTSDLDEYKESGPVRPLSLVPLPLAPRDSQGEPAWGLGLVGGF